MRALALAAALMGLAGLMGAAAASHALRGRVPPEAVEALHTGFLYALIHGAAASLMLLVAPLRPDGARRLRAVAGLWVAGGAVFAGAIALNRIGGFTAAGAAAPLGGVLMMAGWGVLAAHTLRRPS